MKIDLAYDTSGLTVELPDGNVRAILRHSPTPPLADPDKAVRHALAHTVAGPALSALAAGRRDACILICDHTRPAPDRIMLPPILATLEKAGIEPKRILILVATGLHRAPTPRELDRMVGAEVPARYRVAIHDAHRAADHACCCTTGDGTRASIDRRFLDADLKIATGFVEPHLMAGFGGGRKMVAIGVASADTICQLHSPRILENRASREGNLAGNPLHAAATEIARSAGLEFIVHATLDGNKAPTGFFAGAFEPTFEAVVAALRPQVTARLDAACDIVVTSGGGWPLDGTYYQTIKGATAAMPAVRPGGTILVASGCREGLGSRPFCEIMARFRGFDDFRAAILDPVRPYFQVDQWQHERFSHASQRAEIVLAQSMLDPQDRRRLWIRSTDGFEQALADALDRHGPSASIAVLPKGPYVLVETGSD